MPRVAASNGIRPELRALKALKLNKWVKPAEVDAAVKVAGYASKYVSFLNNRYGFEVEAKREGRQVVAYRVVKEPENAAELRKLNAPKRDANGRFVKAA